MQCKMLSVIVGNSACVAACPYCVSGEAPNAKNTQTPTVNWRNFRIACKAADRYGVDTVMLTSRGEPTLFPQQITDYLEHLQPFPFPFVELQTNGIPLSRNPKKYTPFLKKWYELGLTVITLSVVSHLPSKNQPIYAPNGQYIDLPALIHFLHSFGFTLRLTCVLCKGITYTPAQVREFIRFAKQNQVEQVTLRPVNDEFRRPSAKQWIIKHRLSPRDKQAITRMLEKEGHRLLELGRIGTVYDVEEQNVCFCVPLNKYTIETDPNQIRQLIFFQDGHLRYEWEMPGGNLL
ncbi:MAG: radical SAM protein [Elusimicrobiaceae bacterium]|nr:radical SAM protein [Elusimicrobiaceae bacterium]